MPSTSRALFRPTYTALPAILHCVRGAENATTAWERLIADGFLPMAWFDDPDRRFRRAPCEACKCAMFARCKPCMDGIAVATDPHPPTVASCVTIAADRDGIEEAEANFYVIHGSRCHVQWDVVDSAWHPWTTPLVDRMRGEPRGIEGLADIPKVGALPRGLHSVVRDLCIRGTSLRPAPWLAALHTIYRLGYAMDAHRTGLTSLIAPRVPRAQATLSYWKRRPDEPLPKRLAHLASE